MKQKEIFMQYILNNREHLQEDLRKLQQNMRYRNTDEVECLEFIIAKTRLSAFNEFAAQAIAILNLSEPDPVKYVSFDVDRLKAELKTKKEK